MIPITNKSNHLKTVKHLKGVVLILQITGNPYNLLPFQLPGNCLQPSKNSKSARYNPQHLEGLIFNRVPVNSRRLELDAVFWRNGDCYLFTLSCTIFIRDMLKKTVEY